MCILILILRAYILCYEVGAFDTRVPGVYIYIDGNGRILSCMSPRRHRQFTILLDVNIKHAGIARICTLQLQWLSERRCISYPIAQ
ncbi:hypothetical protein SCLCIDRAFT_152513 [Scleroderma citrinum Foug A]|uniref:Secreted protein n=1 Tax=Scleroderma citrinum Foug A TaxID=1036808 RepID=A0A0C3EQR1_9AGAM|nr:hypothetical protein SCLCIDRAFT_152513 [Scleroderma citrinum Foug A]